MFGKNNFFRFYYTKRSTMRVNSVQSYNIYKIPSFKSLGYIPVYYTDVNGIERSTQLTTGVRNDLDYDKLAKIIQTRFPEFDRVNIMPMNVSDGTKAYCIANAIIRNEGLDTFKRRYSPIMATDINKEVIEKYCKMGRLYLFNDDIPVFDRLGIDVLSPVNERIFKDYVLYQEHYPEKLYKLNPEYSKLFDFTVMDLQKRLNIIKDKGNSVISIRNCLRQSFGEKSAPEIIKTASNVLNGKSLLLTGGYDVQMYAIKEALMKYFYEIEKNVWALKK